MADCTTVFETLEGFLPKNILEKAINETNAEMAPKSSLFFGNLIR